MTTVDDILYESAKKLGVSKDIVKKTYESFWKQISLNLKSKADMRYRIPKIGILKIKEVNGKNKGHKED